MSTRFIHALLLLTTICSVEGESKMRKEKYIPYEATSYEIAATDGVNHVDLGGTYEVPADKVLGKHLDRALRVAEDEVARIRNMLAKGLVKKEYWNGTFTGSVIIKDEKVVYHLIFDGNGNKVGQVNKTVFEDEPYGKKVKDKCCTLVFHDAVDSISSFSCGESSAKICLNFYQDRSLASCGIAFDGMYYRAKWANDGKLTSQSKRDLAH